MVVHAYGRTDGRTDTQTDRWTEIKLNSMHNAVCNNEGLHIKLLYGV